ncbi:hypothetical protein RAS1_38620 [Phycisphaerae bacterium RAS1]|nr:hypothetical protein RAS1_38620 [Phycisphaerae bacterium RAS1]
MSLDRRSRIALGLMLIALLALAVDRLILPRPQAASAAGSASPDGTEADGGSAAPAAIPPSDPERAVPEAEFTVADVFALSRIGVRHAANAASDERASAEAFAAAHVLRGTLLGPEPAALLDRRRVRVGQQVDGFTLVEVSRDGAVFSNGSETVALRITSRRTP